MGVHHEGATLASPRRASRSGTKLTRAALAAGHTRSHTPAQNTKAESAYVSAVYLASRLISERSFSPLYALDAIYYRSQPGKRYQAALAVLHGTACTRAP